MELNILKHKLETGMSIREVAEATGKSFTTVRYWMKKHGLVSSHKKANTWTEEELREAVRISSSIAQTLRKIGVQPRGGNYKTFKASASRLGIDISHFEGSSSLKGRPSGRGKPLSAYLKLDGPSIKSSRLKKRLLREGMLDNTCQICGAEPTWNGKELILRLDHKNGNSNDNRIENLRMVCPNCDSQLPTFCGRNIGTITG